MAAAVRFGQTCMPAVSRSNVLLKKIQVLGSKDVVGPNSPSVTVRSFGGSPVSYKRKKSPGSGKWASHGSSSSSPCPKCGEAYMKKGNTILDKTTGSLICKICQVKLLNIPKIEPTLASEELHVHVEEKIKTPKEIFESLQRTVIGQDYAAKALSVALYNHNKRLKYNKKVKQAKTVQNILEDAFKQNLPQDFQKLTTQTNIPAKEDQWSFKADGSSNKVSTLCSSEDKDAVIIEKSNILMIGPTGSGKTLLVKTASEYLGVPFTVCDCTGLTAAGYHGDDVESVIARLLQSAEYDVETCENGIVFLDEVDKIASRGMGNNTRDVGGEGVQQSMLKMLEGTVINVPDKRASKRGETIQVDTTEILFIGSGAFVGLEKFILKRQNEDNGVFGFGTLLDTKDGSVTTLSSFVSSEPSFSHAYSKPSASYISSRSSSTYLSSEEESSEEAIKCVQAKDLIKFGMIPEFCGRMPIVISFCALHKENLVRILTEPRNAILHQYKLQFEMDKCTLHFEDGALDAVASIAMRKQTGARGLKAVLENVLNDAMYEVPGSDIESVTITEACVLGQEAAIYGRRGQRALVRIHS